MRKLLYSAIIVSLFCACCVWSAQPIQPGGLRWKRQQHRRFMAELASIKTQRESIYARFRGGRLNGDDACRLLRMTELTEQSVRWAYGEVENGGH